MVLAALGMNVFLLMLFSRGVADLAATTLRGERCLAVAVGVVLVEALAAAKETGVLLDDLEVLEARGEG